MRSLLPVADPDLELRGGGGGGGLDLLALSAIFPSVISSFLPKIRGGGGGGPGPSPRSATTYAHHYFSLVSRFGRDAEVTLNLNKEL